MKKIIAFIIACLLVFSVMPVSTLGAMPEQATPRWINTRGLTADLTFSGMTGDVVIAITGDADVDNIVASVKLYYKNLSGVWTELKFNWNYDVDQSYLVLHETFVATRGYEYKFDLVATLTKNGVEETITKTVTATCPTN